MKKLKTGEVGREKSVAILHFMLLRLQRCLENNNEFFLRPYSMKKAYPKNTPRKN